VKKTWQQQHSFEIFIKVKNKDNKHYVARKKFCTLKPMISQKPSVMKNPKHFLIIVNKLVMSKTMLRKLCTEKKNESIKTVACRCLLFSMS
jgi:hypothetical protein